MKTNKILKIMSIILISLSLTACGVNPDSTVKNFFISAQKSDITSMATYISKDTTKNSFKYTDTDQEKIAKSVLSKVSYVIVSSSVTGKNAVVKTKVTSLDLPKIYGKLVTDMLPALFTQALSGNTQDTQAQIMTSFSNSINDPIAPKTTIDIDIKLTNVDNKWLIVANDDFQNALTGNMSKAFASATNSAPATPNVKPDPKVYTTNEEAKIGRAAITVTKFELSVGKDYDIPKDGYVFAIVTMKKRNTSKDTISYGTNEFKIQNDKGQIIDPSFTSFGKVLGDGQLAGDGEADGTITFEVPKDNTSLTFMFYSGDEALLKFKVK